MALAAGQLGREAVGERIELDQIEQAMHPQADLGLLGPRAPGSHPQPEGDVLEHRQVAKQGVMLEDEADLALADMGAGGVLAVQNDPASIRGLQPGDHPQQRRLAAAGGAEQRGQCTVGEVE